jgi:hypothetical protein
MRVIEFLTEAYKTYFNQ